MSTKETSTMPYRTVQLALAAKYVSARPGRLVALLLTAAAMLALMMAIVSGINCDPSQWRGPPDEHGHRSAARYYVDHWLPPRVGDPVTLGSYSPDYGFSYVNETDPAYPLAGKFALLLSPLIPDLDLGFRLFNVALLAALAGLCFLRPAAWLVFVPLLLSPQVWYIFSYFNNDALPLFLSVLIVYQVVQVDSLFNRYLDRPGFTGGIGGALLFGLLVAILLLSKQNYFVFLAFLPAVVAIPRLGVIPGAVLAFFAVRSAALYLAWLPGGMDALHHLAAAAALVVIVATFTPPSLFLVRGRMVAKLAIMALVAVMLAAPRIAWDAVAHGSLAQKQAAVVEMQEKVAKPGYKPSEINGPTPDAVYSGIEMRARGTPLKALFAPPWNWHIETFKSSTGVYGWLAIAGPPVYYIAMAISYALLFATYVAALLGSRDKLAWSFLALTTVFSALTVTISVYHSWNNDFQAQGRYLFPILAMVGLALHSVKRPAYTGRFLSVTAACFALSAWSFIFTGLKQIPRSF